MIGDFFYHLHKKLPMIDSFPGIKKISCTYGYCLRAVSYTHLDEVDESVRRHSHLVL